VKRDTITKIGIILRPSTPELKSAFFLVKQAFEKHGIETAIDNISGSMIGVMGQQFEKLCQTCDFLVSIGGDGTLISTVRRSYAYDIPVLGIHAGKLGFLADLNLQDLDQFIVKMLEGNYRIDERAVIEATLHYNHKCTKLYAFNDIVLTRSSISKMIHLETFVDEKAFNTYYGDGLIVATPTGSTAYNLSCGGPVLFPLTHVFALTPISPHSLTQRPVVLPGHFQLEIKTPDSSAVAVVDGQDMHEFNSDALITIKLAERPAQLLHQEAFNYFEILKEKLRWGE